MLFRNFLWWFARPRKDLSIGTIFGYGKFTQVWTMTCKIGWELGIMQNQWVSWVSCRLQIRLWRLQIFWLPRWAVILPRLWETVIYSSSSMFVTVVQDSEKHLLIAAVELSAFQCCIFIFPTACDRYSSLFWLRPKPCFSISPLSQASCCAYLVRCTCHDSIFAGCLRRAQSGCSPCKHLCRLGEYSIP